jgi:hypothetical protein
MSEGLDAVLKGFSQLQRGGEAFAKNRQHSRDAQERQVALDEKRERERVLEERRIAGVEAATEQQGKRIDLLSRLDTDPSITREEALLEAGRFQDPTTVKDTSQSIANIFNARDAAAGRKAETAATSKKEAKALKKEEEAKSLKGRMKALSGENRKRFDSIRMGLNAADDLREALDNGADRFSVLGDNDFTAARAFWTDSISRMQSGAALTEEEASRFEAMAPTKTDSHDQVQKKLDRIENFMAGRLESMGFETGEIRDFRKGVSKRAKESRLGTGKAEESAAAVETNPDRGSVREVDEAVFDKFLDANRQVFDSKVQQINSRRQQSGKPPLTEQEIQAVALELAKRKAGIRMKLD